MQLWTGALSWWWPDLKSAGLFRRNPFLNILKPQHSTPNPNPFSQSTLVYRLPYSPQTSHHLSQAHYLAGISYATQKLMLDLSKMLQRQSEAFHTFLWHFFPSLKQNFIAYHSSKLSNCIFEIHQVWQSGFSRVYSNSCCCCSFEAEIIKIHQWSHKMYSNNKNLRQF